MSVKVTVQPFGEWEGRTVNKYTITELAGIQVSLINYGAAITGIIVPDRSGSPADVVLGFETLEGYLESGRFYFGGICGRYANRIANGTFRINGNEYSLSKNGGVNCLHGGFQGFDKKYWEAELLPAGNGVKFGYCSKDGEEGFPGNLKVEVTYTVMDHALHIEYCATTDKASPVNITNHCYFNLSGGKDQNILNHQIQLNADKVLEVDDKLIPTGNMKEVKNTDMDFTTLRTIGNGDGDHGFDYSWVLRKQNGELFKAVSLFHPDSGREMTVYTTQPAVHFYAGHFLEGNLPDTKKGLDYGKFAGLCLETQHFPDSPNHPGFPDTIVVPGKTYSEKTVFHFSSVYNNSKQ